MAYTARELITDAFYLSGVVSQGQQQLTGYESNAGLRALNKALAVETLTGTLIPYYQEHAFDFVAGQEKYSIDNLMAIENAVYNINQVRYSLRPVNRNNYFGRPRADNITSLPYQYHFERRKNGGDFYVYFIPSENFPAKIWGKFGLTKVDNLEVDLEIIYAKEYLTYLEYLLAQYICEAYDITLSEQTQYKLAQIIEGLHYESPLDLTMRKVSVFSKTPSMNYAWANLGTGWMP